MISGSPPTDRNARTGLFTPPTSTFSARSNIFSERLRSRFNRGCAVLILVSLKLARLQPACDVLGMVGKNNFRSGSLNARKNFQDNSLLVQPAFLRRSLHHGVLSADIVNAHGNIKSLPHPPADVQDPQPPLDHP